MIQTEEGTAVAAFELPCAHKGQANAERSSAQRTAASRNTPVSSVSSIAASTGAAPARCTLTVQTVPLLVEPIDWTTLLSVGDSANAPADSPTGAHGLLAISRYRTTLPF